MSLGVRTRYVGTVWYLQLHEDGSCSVAQRGRTVLSEVTPLQARRYLRKNRKRGEKAFQVAPDGYRTLI